MMTRRWWTMLLLAGFGCVQDAAAHGDAGSGSVTRAASDSGTPTVTVIVRSLDAGADGSAAGTTSFPDGGMSVDAGTAEVFPGSMQVSCGSVVCKNPLAMVGNSLKLAEPCCLDAATSHCGWVASDVCTPPPPLDTRCPSLTVPSLLPSLPPMPADPCCTSTGRCGIALPQTSLGCFETRSFPGGPVAPMNCDGTPIADVDAGP